MIVTDLLSAGLTCADCRMATRLHGVVFTVTVAVRDPARVNV